MVDAIQFRKTGGPEMLERVSITLPEPGLGEVRIRHSAIGLNFIDIYQRTGLYPTSLPTILGTEAAGVIEAVGAGVSLSVGTRVAYARGPLGAYASERIMPANHCVPLPENVSDVVAASSMLKGLTAWYLLHETFPVRSGDTILVHAAAGGVGQILCQWAKQLGVTVIGTVGSEAKAVIAKKAGCDHVIFYRTEDVAARVRALTNRVGVHVVYDAVGKATFMASLNALKPLGMMVSFGQASGPIPAFELSELAKRGSLFITRPSLKDYIADDATYQRAAKALLTMIGSGKLPMHVSQRYALADAADAHRALEARETTGSSVLIP
ncbi:MAG: quinone oxidoreductase [Rickettsiales bacterium]|nr:quinone oxidoreductase [Rickettsiales bacterium]